MNVCFKSAKARIVFIYKEAKKGYVTIVLINFPLLISIIILFVCSTIQLQMIGSFCWVISMLLFSVLANNRFNL